MSSVFWYCLAALGEIAGCFSFWAWLRQGKSIFWLIPGCFALAVFAAALTRIDSAHAGRAYAAYGGVYIAASILWLWAFEGVRPDRWDILGASICLFGTAILIYGPRASSTP